MRLTLQKQNGFLPGLDPRASATQTVGVMKRFRFEFLTLCVVATSYGCASVETRLPIPDINLMAKESSLQEKQAFARYQNMLKRLDRISSKIVQTNADLCEKTRPDAGIITHTRKSYPKHLRDSAAKQLGARDIPSVLYVRDGGPANDSGLFFGDVLVDEKNKPIDIKSKPAVEMLNSGGKLRKRALTEAGYSEIELTPVPACAYPVRLKFSETVNAYATGKSIIVTTGMMDFAERDEELALVLGHELAHNTMSHVPKSIRNIILSGFATRTTRPFEAEADYVGLYYMARAGYELQGVEDFWRRLGVKNPKSIVRAKTHPVTPGRLLSIRSAAEEIATKQQAGEKLVPNYLDGKEPGFEN